MIQKIKRSLLMLSTALMLAMPMGFTMVGMGYADSGAGCNSIGNNIATGANDAIGGNSDVSCSPSSVSGNIGTLASQIVNIFSLIVGVVAVIMIIYGGFRYITSGGDSGSVGNAKNTLVYAIVGLIIVALAQLIVHYVLGQTSTITQ